MPEYDTDAYRYIQRVLCTELRNLKAHVSCIHNILTHTCDLVSEHYRILAARLRLESVKHHRAYSLLGTYHSISVLLKTTDRIHRIIDMLPRYAVLSTKGGLMDFSRRRYGTYSAKPYLVYLE